MGGIFLRASNLARVQWAFHDYGTNNVVVVVSRIKKVQGQKRGPTDPKMCKAKDEVPRIKKKKDF